MFERSFSLVGRLLSLFALDYKFLKITDFRYLVDTLKMYLWLSLLLRKANLLVDSELCRDRIVSFNKSESLCLDI
ncbi:hypothetical protein DCO56_06195 [Sphingobacterium athyrii]|uniref:Uncharacterized protein n=1 Tax=Sphingobacterium athyrii TaxID=2152717 RepID=A0A363P0K1_9SPHI|nr:hypothetical protein DCO56_06195 [Sphingobacterium athyrii]